MEAKETQCCASANTQNLTSKPVIATTSYC